MLKKRKTLKFVLKGDIVTRTVRFETEDGEVFEYDEKKKILVPSKKNQKTPMVSSSGKAFLLPSQQFRIWKEEHSAIFDQWNVDLYNKGVSLPITRFKIKFLFYFPDIKRRDLLNKALTIEDELKTHGIILDDSFTVVNDYNIKGWVKRDKPRTELYLTILPHNDPEFNVDITDPSYAILQKKKRAIQKRIQRANKKLD